jgi:hypothetical protein
MAEIGGDNLSFRIHRNSQKETNPNVQGMELTTKFSRVRVLGLEMVLELLVSSDSCNRRVLRQRSLTNTSCARGLHAQRELGRKIPAIPCCIQEESTRAKRFFLCFLRSGRLWWWWGITVLLEKTMEIIFATRLDPSPTVLC